MMIKVDKVNQYQQLSLVDLGKIEIGPEPTLWLAKVVLHEMSLKIYRSKWLLSHTESCNAQSRREWKRYTSVHCRDAADHQASHEVRCTYNRENLREKSVNLTKTSLASVLKTKALWPR